MNKLREDIKTQNFKKAYLLYGEETYLRQQYKERLVKALNPEGDTMNFTHYEGKDIPVAEIISFCETMPFFADRRVALIENSGFFKNKCEELADYLKDYPDYVTLIFVEEEVDKRSRMYKSVKKTGYEVEFKRQGEQVLMRWAAGILSKEGKKITQRDMQMLLEMTGDDMGIIRMELEKLISYTMGRDVINSEDIRTICTTQIENKIFEMIRAVADKKQSRALDLYNDLLMLKESPMKILTLLSRQYHQLFLVKKMSEEGLAQKEIAAKLGVQDFVVRNLSYCARAYKEHELVAAQHDFAEYEEAVKMGRLQDSLSVELLIVKYSSAGK